MIQYYLLIEEPIYLFIFLIMIFKVALFLCLQKLQNRGNIYKKVDNVIMLQNTVIFCDKESLLVFRERYVLPAANLLASLYWLFFWQIFDAWNDSVNGTCEQLLKQPVCSSKDKIICIYIRFS